MCGQRLFWQRPQASPAKSREHNASSPAQSGPPSGVTGHSQFPHRSSSLWLWSIPTISQQWNCITVLPQILGSQTPEKDSGRSAPPQTTTGRKKAPTGRKIALFEGRSQKTADRSQKNKRSPRSSHRSNEEPRDGGPDPPSSRAMDFLLARRREQSRAGREPTSLSVLGVRRPTRGDTNVLTQEYSQHPPVHRTIRQDCERGEEEALCGTFITLSRIRKKSLPISGLVKKSAMFSAVATKGTRRRPFSTHSRMK